MRQRQQTVPASSGEPAAPQLRHIRRGSLELGRFLAKGAFGAVYEADHHGARVVAKLVQNPTDEVRAVDSANGSLLTACVRVRVEPR